MDSLVKAASIIISKLVSTSDFIFLFILVFRHKKMAETLSPLTSQR